MGIALIAQQETEAGEFQNVRTSFPARTIHPGSSGLDGSPWGPNPQYTETLQTRNEDQGTPPCVQSSQGFCPLEVRAQDLSHVCLIRKGVRLGERLLSASCGLESGRGQIGDALNKVEAPKPLKRSLKSYVAALSWLRCSYLICEFSTCTPRSP